MNYTQSAIPRIVFGGVAALILLVLRADALAQETAATPDAHGALRSVLLPVPESMVDNQDSSETAVPADAEASPIPERIQERYPNRSIKIERWVVQDAAGNYVNHGEWKWFDDHGRLLAQGTYRYGKRHGRWMRIYRGDEARLFQTSEFKAFQSPFVSYAEFVDGQLHGRWTIVDAKRRVVARFSFANGLRDGPVVFYYPNGRQRTTTTFSKGTITSEESYDANGRLVSRQQYQDGRALITKVAYYRGTRQKQFEGTYLSPPLVQKTPDDWWNASPATYETAAGKQEKHGLWTRWYPNGQIAQQGTFEHDIPIGHFTWWYSNGQKAAEGNYQHGLPTGQWVWWHANGLKKSIGEYLAGEPTGPWIWWAETGKLTQRADFTHSAAKVAERPRRDVGELPELPPIVPVPSDKLKVAP